MATYIFKKGKRTKSIEMEDAVDLSDEGNEILAFDRLGDELKEPISRSNPDGF